MHPSLLVRSSAAVDRWCESGPWRRVRFQFRKPIEKARTLTEKQDDWTRRALAEGRALLRDRDVNVVWTTSGPYRTIGVGRRLQRRHRKPWVADLRDSIARERAWVGLLGTIAGRRQRRRWFRALKKASVVVDVTPQEAEIDSTALGRRCISLPSAFDLTTWESLRRSDEPNGADTPGSRSSTQVRSTGRLPNKATCSSKACNASWTRTLPADAIPDLSRAPRGPSSFVRRNDMSVGTSPRTAAWCPRRKLAWR